ncbi:MAG: 4Fe-4S dicluster domain-containing protein [Anaerolineales bacterium]|nr:MAG: 4Fe-4S dicluster domain-containing protein [Anaerolineales bacterium]
MADTIDAYERLADRLSNTPNGLPRSPSGAELRLLAKMFRPEEAALASVMHLYREDVADIAARAGLDEKDANSILKRMARRGLIYGGRGKKGLAFGLLPFVIGSLEESLPYLDEEMAQLFDTLLVETKGDGLLGPGPALTRVIPVEQSVDAEVELLPYERASELLEKALSFGVRECICRKYKALIGEACDYERFNCLSFAPVEGAFLTEEHVRPIERDEALRILREAEEAGLVHTTYNWQDGAYFICNCCPCCCGITRGVVEFGRAHALAHSDFYAAVEADECTACEACVERCHFGALSVPDDVVVVDTMHCMGCGLCVSECPSDALRLVRRAVEEHAAIPTNRRQWQEQRAEARGVPLDELL